MFAIFSYNFYIYLSQAVLFTKMLCFLQSLDNSVLTQVIRVHYSNCYNISVLNILRIYLFFIPLFMLLYICVSFLYYHLIIFNLFGNKNWEMITARMRSTRYTILRPIFNANHVNKKTKI